MILASALVAGTLLRTFVAQGFTVSSGSMEPTLLVGDNILVNKLAYAFRWPWNRDQAGESPGPRRGDVVVFEFHAAANPEFAERVAGDDRSVLPFVKRVVGVAGDSVEIRDQRLLVDGHELNVSGFASGSDGAISDFGPVQVPPGTVFVLGDNLAFSTDSRQLGPVPRADILGRAVLVYWSAGSTPIDVRWSRVGSLIR